MIYGDFIKKVILCAYIFISFSIIYSHPHMQILNRSVFDFKDDKIVGVWLEWEFDTYFSSDIIMTYDLDSSGDFNKKEIEDIYNNAFIALKDSNYFTYIRTGDKRSSPTEVSDFTPYITDSGDLVYKFYIEFDESIGRNFYLSIYDFTYFCACFYQEEDPVLFNNIGSNKPKFSIVKKEDKPIYFDPYAGPDEKGVFKEWREGLSEVVIKEIHIEY